MITLKPMPRAVGHRNKRQHYRNLYKNADDGGQRCPRIQSKERYGNCDGQLKEI